MPARNIAVLVGSLRREAFSLRVANALKRLQPPTLNLEIVPIGQLPFYNQDDEEQPPQPWVDFRNRIRASNAVIFVTPEYNRSMPAALKNALDVGSRPYGKSAWEGKPCGIVSTSPGAIGGFGAHHHLRQSLVFLDMPAMQQPEAYIGGADKLFAEDGSISNPATKEFMTKYLAAFEQWISRNAAT